MWEVYKARDREGGKEKAFEAVRCGFCHTPAPAEDAARALEQSRVVRAYAKARSNKKTDSQRAKEASDSKKRAAARKVIQEGSREFV